MIAVLPLVLLAAAPPGISVQPGAAPPLRSQSDQVVPRTRAIRASDTKPAEPPRAASCAATAAAEPERAVEIATKWRDGAKGAERASAMTCLGEAYSELGRWAKAEAAFLAARETIPGDAQRRARLLAMAGHAAFAGGASERALNTFERAAAEARLAGLDSLSTDLAVDRARALVALGRAEDAEAILATARAAEGASGEVWLLSATLARRQAKFDTAQAHIERAAQLLPQDAEVALEAGVIAVLAGRDEAARKSWQSVLATAPDSPMAETARGYLAQLAVPAGRTP